VAAEGAAGRIRRGRGVRGLARYALIAFACSAVASHAQVAPSPAEITGYKEFHAAAARGIKTALT